MVGKGGAHQWNTTEREQAQQDKVLSSLPLFHATTDCKQFTNYGDVIYSLAIGFTKISIILLVLRVFCPQRRDPFYWVLQSLNLLNTIFYSIFFFVHIFQCTPRRKIWLAKMPGRCLDVVAVYISSVTFNICSDLAMYFIPLWKIWHLQIPKSRKLGISAIFATGGL